MTVDAIAGELAACIPRIPGARTIAALTEDGLAHAGEPTDDGDALPASACF